MGILREQELIKEAALAIQSFEMKFGTGAIAWHASVDMIHLLYGIVHCPVYVEVYQGEERLESSLADCDRHLYGIEDYSHSEGQRHATFAGDYRIVVRPLASPNSPIPSPIYGDQETVQFSLRLNLVDALTDDRATSDALQRYLNARAEKEQRELREYVPEVPNLPVEAMRPVLWDLLESRVRSILRPLLASELSEEIDGVKFERVWIGVKVLGDRNQQRTDDINLLFASRKPVQDALPLVPESAADNEELGEAQNAEFAEAGDAPRAFQFEYSIRWIPTESQVRLAASLLSIPDVDAKKVLESETSIGARSTMDTCALSGFLTTKIGDDKRAANLLDDDTMPEGFLETLDERAKANLELGKKRSTFFQKVDEKMRGTGPEIILVDTPIHVHSCVYFCVRCHFHYRDRPRTIVFLNEYITILSSQLRQLAHEAMMRDLDDRIEHSLLSDPANIFQGLQATFPMPKWHVENRTVKIEEPEPRFWHAHFNREEDTDAFSRELTRILQRRDIVEFQSAKLPYLEEARELAERALVMRLKSPTHFLADEVGKPTVVYANVKKLEPNPVIRGRGDDVTDSYRDPNRSILIAGIMIGALASFLFNGQQKQSLFVKKLLLASDPNGTLRWTKYYNSWRGHSVESQLYPGSWNWPDWEQLFPDGHVSSAIELSNREADEIVAWVRWSVALILKNRELFDKMIGEFDREESKTGTKAMAHELAIGAVTDEVVPSVRKYLSRMRTVGTARSG